MTKKGNILLNRTLSLCSAGSPGTLLFFGMLCIFLAALSFCRPFAAARILPFILWLMLAWLALFSLEAGWNSPKLRKLAWGFALLAAGACPVLALTVKVSRLAGAGAGVLCVVFALMSGAGVFDRKNGVAEKLYDFLLFGLFGGAGVLAFLSFGYHYEAAARRYGVLFMAAALECAARLCQYFYRRKKQC